MWKNFCRHVEKNQIEKNEIVEDTLDEMVITIGEEESDDEDDKRAVVWKQAEVDKNACNRISMCLIVW